MIPLQFQDPEFWGTVTAAITGFMGWLIGKKQRRKEKKAAKKAKQEGVVGQEQKPK